MDRSEGGRPGVTKADRARYGPTHANAALGDAIAAAAILIISAIGPTFDFGRETGLVLSPQLDVGQMLMISAVVLLVAVIGTVQPAFKASRMEPVEALRRG